MEPIDRKTYTALAVIKYFEQRNERVLVLCPKKLTRNWTIYRNPSSLNPFQTTSFGTTYFITPTFRANREASMVSTWILSTGALTTSL